MNQETSIRVPGHETEPAPTAGNHQDREIPLVGQGVWIDGRDGVHVVLRTDIVSGTVQVLQTSGIRQIRDGVPLSAIRIAKDRSKATTISFKQD